MDEKVKFYIQAFSLLIICSVLLVIFKQCDSFININNMVDSQGYQINSSASRPMATTQVPPADVAAAAGTGYTPPSSYTGTAALDQSYAAQAAQIAQERQSRQTRQTGQTTQAQTTQVSAPPPEDSGTSTAVYVVATVAVVGAVGGGVYLLMVNKVF